MIDVRLQTLLDAAEAHGRDSEPDHEVGDLQLLLVACWERLTDADRQAIYDASTELREWMEPDTAR